MIYTDDRFAASAHQLLKQIRGNDVSCHDMVKKESPTNVVYPPNLNIYTGTPAVSQKRRAAYAKKAGAKSVSDWAREVLDQAAGFEEGK